MLYIYAKFSENLITRILGPITRKFEYRRTSVFAVDASQGKTANTEFAYKKTNRKGKLGDRFLFFTKKVIFIYTLALIL